MSSARGNWRFCGKEFTGEELSLIKEVVQSCGGISRRELAHTVCELLDWKRAWGGLKGRECRDLLERLEEDGFLVLPVKKPTTGWCKAGISGCCSGSLSVGIITWDTLCPMVQGYNTWPT